MLQNQDEWILDTLRGQLEDLRRQREEIDRAAKSVLKAILKHRRNMHEEEINRL